MPYNPRLLIPHLGFLGACLLFVILWDSTCLHMICRQQDGSSLSIQKINTNSTVWKCSFYLKLSKVSFCGVKFPISESLLVTQVAVCLLHQQHTWRWGHSWSWLSSRPCYGWLPTVASPKQMNLLLCQAWQTLSCVTKTCSLIGYEPCSSVQASKTGDDTMSDQIYLLFWFFSSAWCQNVSIVIFNENLTLDQMMIVYVFVLCLEHSNFWKNRKNC